MFRALTLSMCAPHTADKHSTFAVETLSCLNAKQKEWKNIYGNVSAHFVHFRLIISLEFVFRISSSVLISFLVYFVCILVCCNEYVMCFCLYFQYARKKRNDENCTTIPKPCRAWDEEKQKRKTKEKNVFLLKLDSGRQQPTAAESQT